MTAERRMLAADTLDRMVRAVEQVKQRLRRAAQALTDAGVPYVVVGGHAVAAWVVQVDEAAVRNTRDVDILIRRDDLPAVRLALEAAGFRYHQVDGIDMFLDGPDARAREAVHLVYAEERVRPEYLLPAPSVGEAVESGGLRVLGLEALVRMKLTSYRRKDQVHLLDLLSLGLIDRSWCGRFPPLLADRLQVLVNDPDG